jgi:hypothetical protein
MLSNKGDQQIARDAARYYAYEQAHAPVESNWKAYLFFFILIGIWVGSSYGLSTVPAVKDNGGVGAAVGYGFLIMFCVIILFAIFSGIYTNARMDNPGRRSSVG